MANTINPIRKRQSLNSIPGFRCRGCNGKAYHDNGRTRVIHRQDCAIFSRMTLTHPRFYEILDSYRSTNGN